LQPYLKNASNPFFDKSMSIDGKSLSEYYVENKAYNVLKSTYYQDEKDIERKEEWTLDFLLRGNDKIVVIAAPFGIGKSSLAKKYQSVQVSSFKIPLIRVLTSQYLFDYSPHWKILVINLLWRTIFR
jgi:hypothetical protein